MPLCAGNKPQASHTWKGTASLVVGRGVSLGCGKLLQGIFHNLAEERTRVVGCSGRGLQGKQRRGWGSPWALMA